jgi:hypothetical protein
LHEELSSWITLNYIKAAHVQALQSLLFINFLELIGYLMHQQAFHSKIVHSAHTAIMCFVFISEQTATFVYIKSTV